MGSLTRMAGGVHDVSLIREYFDYNAQTGALVWKKKPAIAVSAGDLAGNIQPSNGYRYVSFKGYSIRAHRLIWALFYGEWPEGDLDHINGIRSDNRISNLRDAGRCSNAQNERKARKNNKSTGLLGSYKAGNRYRAIIHVDGNPVHLGRFDTAEDAHAAYVAAKRKFHAGCTI